MANVPMIVTIEDDGDKIRVRISHDMRASYSRAVDPRANKEILAYLRRTGMRSFTQIVLVDADHDLPSVEDDPRRCITVYYYELS